MVNPLDVAVSSEGQVFVRDATGDRIFALDREGYVVRSWGGTGTEDGQFDFANPGHPHSTTVGGMAIIDQTLFVVEKHRVQAFDFNGRFLRAWGSPGRKPGRLFQTQGTAAGPDGNLYIVDPVRKVVQVFSPDGTLVRHWLIPISDGEYFSTICVTEAGEVVIAEEIGDEAIGKKPGVRIHKFSTAGRLLLTWGRSADDDGQDEGGEFGAGTSGTACGADGRIYVSDAAADRVQVFDPDGKFLFDVTAPLGAKPNGAIASLGADLFVTDQRSGNVSKFRLTQ